MREYGYWAIAVGILLWLVVIASSYVLSGPVFWALLAIAQVWLPVAIYLDIGYVRTVSAWQPNRLIWTIMAIPWLINLPVAGLYLFNRLRLRRVVDKRTTQKGTAWFDPPETTSADSRFVTAFRRLGRESLDSYGTTLRWIIGLGAVAVVLGILSIVTPLDFVYLTILAVILVFVIMIIRAQWDEPPQR